MLLLSFIFRNFKEKENSGLGEVEELPKSENKIDQVNVMDISSHAVDEVEMQDPEVEDFDADGMVLETRIHLVVEYAC